MTTKGKCKNCNHYKNGKCLFKHGLPVDSESSCFFHTSLSETIEVNYEKSSDYFRDRGRVLAEGCGHEWLLKINASQLMSFIEWSDNLNMSNDKLFAAFRGYVIGVTNSERGDR